jgi:hypothetical protein
MAIHGQLHRASQPIDSVSGIQAAIFRCEVKYVEPSRQLRHQFEHDRDSPAVRSRNPVRIRECRLHCGTPGNHIDLFPYCLRMFDVDIPMDVGADLLDQDAEFIVGEVADGSDRVDRRCGIVVFGVSSKPDLDVLRILKTSFCMLYLHSALRCVPSVDATRRQLTARPIEVFSMSPPTTTRQPGIATSTDARSARRPFADSG